MDEYLNAFHDLCYDAFFWFVKYHWSSLSQWNFILGFSSMQNGSMKIRFVRFK